MTIQGEATAHEEVFPRYVAIWRPILMGWLEWPESRFAAWVAAWDYRIRNVSGQRVWFYHEDELDRILRLLVPDELARDLESKRTGRMYNDLAELLHEAFSPAITGRPFLPSWGTDEFDWDAARCRLERVLGKYDATLPRSPIVSSYERRILEAAHA